MGKDEQLNAPLTVKERVALMKRTAKGLAQSFQEMVMSIPEDTDTKANAVEDFLPGERM